MNYIINSLLKLKYKVTVISIVFDNEFGFHKRKSLKSMIISKLFSFLIFRLIYLESLYLKSSHLCIGYRKY